MSKEASLTPKEERFCQEYVIDLNGKQAAIRAGYSEKSAAVTASRLLIKANVVQRIQTLMDERSKRTEINSDTILRELLKLATSDLRKLFREDGALKSPDEWPDDVAVAVSSIDVEELFEGYGEERVWTGYTKKVKFWDKTRALELLGKHLKLFSEKVEHTHKFTLEDLVAGSHDVKEG